MLLLGLASAAKLAGKIQKFDARQVLSHSHYFLFSRKPFAVFQKGAKLDHSCTHASVGKGSVRVVIYPKVRDILEVMVSVLFLLVVL